MTFKQRGRDVGLAKAKPEHVRMLAQMLRPHLELYQPDECRWDGGGGGIEPAREPAYHHQDIELSVRTVDPNTPSRALPGGRIDSCPNCSPQQTIILMQSCVQYPAANRQALRIAKDILCPLAQRQRP